MKFIFGESTEKLPKCKPKYFQHPPCTIWGFTVERILKGTMLKRQILGVIWFSIQEHTKHTMDMDMNGSFRTNFNILF